MSDGAFTCERCGASFDLSAATRARYPGWRPRFCAQHHESSPDRRGRTGDPLATSDEGARRVMRSGKPPLLTTGQVLERYSRGPDTGVFTDGSCSGNPGPGGWGAVRVDAGRVVAERYGADPQTTNNRMELTAMIEGLRMVEPSEAIDVYSDSRLVVQTVTTWATGWERRGWKRSDGPVKNLDLVQEAYRLAQSRPLARIQWIRAHDGSRWNEYADALATAYLRSEV